MMEEIKVNDKPLKFLDYDKFLLFMMSNYKMYCANIKNRANMVYSAWTLFEDEFIDIKELYLLIDVFTQNTTIKIDLKNEKGETLKLDPLELIEFIKAKFSSTNLGYIKYLQFMELFEFSFIFKSHNAS